MFCDGYGEALEESSVLSASLLSRTRKDLDLTLLATIFDLFPYVLDYCTSTDNCKLILGFQFSSLV